MKIKVKAVPNSKTEEISRAGDGFIVKVKDPPREGKANKAVIKLLAEYFGVPQDSIVILTAFKSRNKVIDVSGV